MGAAHAAEEPKAAAQKGAADREPALFHWLDGSRDSVVLFDTTYRELTPFAQLSLDWS